MKAAATPSLNAESHPVRSGHAHFSSMTNEDGSIAAIVRDGILHNELATSEPADKIVSICLQIAAADLERKKNGAARSAAVRAHPREKCRERRKSERRGRD